MHQWLHDLRHGWRALRLRPGMSAVIVLTLALGIGGVVVILDLYNVFFWRQPAVARPREVVGVYTASPQGFAGRFGSLSWLDYLDYQRGSRAFSGLAAHQQMGFVLDAGQGAAEADVWAVSGSFFPVLGLRPALGRLLTADDDRSGAPPVAVLSHDTWQELGGGEVVGRPIRLARHVLVVVGVAPAGFRGTFAGVRPAVFVPAHLGFEVLAPADATQEDRARQAWSVIGRLAPGVTPAAAEAELALVARRLDAQYPVDGWTRQLTTQPLTLGHPLDKTRMAPTLRVFGVAIAMLVLIVCANVASLLLSRAAARQREMAIRASLGARRWPLVRRLLSESLVLGSLGGLAGLGLAFLNRWLLSAYFGPELVADMHFDARVVLLTVAASFAVTLLFGLAPALATTRVDLAAALKPGERRGGRQRRWAAGPALVVAQVAMSLVLLTASTALVGSLWRFWQADLGFDGDRLLLARVDAAQGSYSREDGLRLFARLRERAATLPGVRSVGLSYLVAPVFLDVSARLRLPEDPDRVVPSRFDVADAASFGTLGLPLLEGRLFAPGDATSGRGVVVVNRRLAELAWPGQPALGRVVRLERARPGDPGTDYEVVGVVGDITQFAGATEREPMVYFDLEQRYRESLNVLLRTEGGDPTATFAALREELRRLDPALALGLPRTHRDHRWESIAEQRLQAQTMAIFGSAGLLLALLGVAGVMTHAVSRQVREIGIRMAVGARRADVLRWVVRRGLALALTGVGVGLLGSLWALRLLQRWVTGLDAVGPAALAAAAVLLLTASAAATLVPARRAAALDPVTALRQE